jgi:hypothetical protein
MMPRLQMRIERSLALSVGLHIVAALFVSSSVGTAAPLIIPQQASAAVLTVAIKPPKILPVAGEETVAPSYTQTHAARPIPVASAEAGSITENRVVVQKARFLADPDLSVLETMPVSMAGRIVLSLAISHLGTVKSVTLASGDPIPYDLLAAITNVFSQARLQPALDGDGKSLDSELKIVVGFEPNHPQD